MRTEATWGSPGVFSRLGAGAPLAPGGPLNGASDEAALVAAVVSAGAALGLDVSRPFPFRVSGRAEAIRFHVLDKRDDLPHTPERHESAKTGHDRARTRRGGGDSIRNATGGSSRRMMLTYTCTSGRPTESCRAVKNFMASRRRDDTRVPSSSPGDPRPRDPTKGGAMKLSARNVIKGRDHRGREGGDDRAREARRGQRHRDHRIYHNRGRGRARLKTGDTAYAVIKASDVMVGKD